MHPKEHPDAGNDSVSLTTRLKAGWLGQSKFMLWTLGDGSAQAVLELTSVQQQAFAAEASPHREQGIEYAMVTLARATRNALIELLSLPVDRSFPVDFGPFALDTRMWFHFDGEKVIWQIDIEQMRQILVQLGAKRSEAAND